MKPNNTHHAKNIVPPKLMNGQYAAVANNPNATANPTNTKIANNPNVPMDNFLLNWSFVFRIMFTSPLAMQPYNAKTSNPTNIPNFATMPVNIKSDVNNGNLDNATNDSEVLPINALLVIAWFDMRVV